MTFLSKIKSLIQLIFRRFGLRIVPKNRDAENIVKQIEIFKISTVIDVGANRGDTLQKWRRMFPEAHVHAFEPLPSMQAVLEAVRAEAPDHVTIWQLAASDSDGEATFQVHVDHPSSSSLFPRTALSAELFDFTQRQSEIVVRTARLDGLIGPKSKTPVTGAVLIKLDVQGAELSVLRGATEILAQTEFIICEVNLADLYEGQSSFRSILEFVENQGFRFNGFLEQFSTNDGVAVYVDVLFARKVALQDG